MGDLRANRGCLWRVAVRYQKDLAVETTHHLQSRGGARREQGSEGQPALRGHQLKTESAVDLRAGLLSAGGRREQDKGIARRHADRPDQLFELFGEHLPSPTYGGGVCADARDAPALGTDPPRPGASLDLARTFLEAGRSGGGLVASHLVTLSPVRSRSRYLSSAPLTLC